MAGYSGRPLYQKLGMKDGSRWLVVHPPENYLEILGTDYPPVFGAQDPPFDAVHIFAFNRAFLEEEVHRFKDLIEKDGMIWISWYKKASKIDTDVTEDVIRSVVLPLGLVDVKVCAVDDLWSGLKVVWRKEMR